jgi:hypothetical protein
MTQVVFYIKGDISMRYAHYLSYTALLLCLTILSACGGSDSASNNTPVPASTVPVPTTVVSGIVFAGPASGATVTAKTTAGALVATSSTVSDSNGAFTIAVPTATLSSDLIFATSGSGATFPDEATGASTTLGTLSVFVPAGTLSASSTIVLDPSSTIVQKLIAGGKTKPAAFTAYSSSFGYKPDFTIKPSFANLSSVATTPQRLAGFRAAAFSQLTKDIKDPSTGSGIGGADKQFELIQALADDLSDGTLDGKKSGAMVKTASNYVIPEDVQNQYNASLINFQNSTNNKSKLKPEQINVPVSGRISLTPTYRVEYVPPANGELVSADTFQLKISKRSDGTAATGLAESIVINPYMVMGAMGMGSHWPNVITETATPGVYSGTAHYSMETYWGLDMYWKLNVFIGTETAAFYPNISAFKNMDTVSVSYYSSSDKTTTTGTTLRAYRLWRESLIAGTGGKYDLAIFVSAPDGTGTYGSVTSSKNYPVYSGLTWSSTSLVISTLKVQVYDGANWVDLTPVGTTGKYTASGLSLTPGTQGSLYVRLLVNGTPYTNAKTGPAWDGSNLVTSNAVQTFKATP